jgi:hypothetical protein
VERAMTVECNTYFRIPSDEELYERPVTANFGTKEYDSIFDPFGLTDIGQRYIFLTLDDLAIPINVAVVEPTNPATGNASYEYLLNWYFDGDTGNYLAAYVKEQSILGAVVIQNALSVGVTESEPNNLSSLSDLGLNMSLHFVDKEGRIFEEDDDDFLFAGQVVRNLDQSELDISTHALRPSDYTFDFEFIPTLKVDPLSGEFVQLDISLMGSSGLGEFWDTPGNTTFDSVINNTEAG